MYTAGTGGERATRRLGLLTAERTSSLFADVDVDADVGGSGSVDGGVGGEGGDLSMGRVEPVGCVERVSWEGVLLLTEVVVVVVCDSDSGGDDDDGGGNDAAASTA